MPSLDVSLRVKADNAFPVQLPGQQLQQAPMLIIAFYDDKQNPVGERGMGPWLGTFPWRIERESLKVPPKAAHAIVRVGLLGATGEISFDDVNITAGR